MKVAEIMTTSLVTVSLDDTLEKIKGIFDQIGFHHVLALGGSKLYGVISDRDVLRHLSPSDISHISP